MDYRASCRTSGNPQVIINTAQRAGSTPIRQWLDLVRHIKLDSLRIPVLQEEFAAIVPGWSDL